MTRIYTTEDLNMMSTGNLELIGFEEKGLNVTSNNHPEKQIIIDIDNQVEAG